jgi:hypothetical protein
MNPKPDWTSESTLAFEPRLSPDFAARVMHEAGRIRARRQFGRHIASAVSVGILAVGVYLMPTLHAPASNSVASTNLASSDSSVWDEGSETNIAAYTYTEAQDAGINQNGAADYLFPDMQSLQDFSNEYSDTSNAPTDDLTWNSENI